ncbi:MAG: hypothetical protein U1C46_07780 [Bacteroidales bacterium]|nr:hypothetical protein [Bacteroidales bacterium]MDZ4204704.1 hypothetical protein [Bacteroidales bacterium]
MRTLFVIIVSILLSPFSFTQDLRPATPREITYRGEIAYLGNSPFTGNLFDEKTEKLMGEFRNGYKNGMFVEYFDNAIMKSRGKFEYGVKEEIHTEWYGNGKRKSEIAFADGKWNGIYLEWFLDGNKSFEGSYARGNKDGTCIEYYENGNKKSEIVFSAGQRSGLFLEWFLNGNKCFDGTYLYGVKNGVFTEYFENGVKKFQSGYNKDVLDGVSQEFYPNGNLKRSMIYANGRKHGKYTEWHENGELKKEMHYNNDRAADGKIIEYDDAGEKINELECSAGVIYSEYSYKDNKQTYYYDYFRGTKGSEGLLKNGIKDGFWTEWHINGQKSFEGSYSNGKRDGIGIEYDTQGKELWNGQFKEGEIHGKGKLTRDIKTYIGEWDMAKKHGMFTEISNDGAKAEGQYSNDIREGLWTEWYSNGNRSLETTYTNGTTVNGSYTEWYENGQKKVEKFYLNDQLNGRHTHWFSNGKLAFSYTYVKGKVVDGQYFILGSDGGILTEMNYFGGKKISEYAYSGKTKHGHFVEYYENGEKKMEGRYFYDTRKVEQRYGANKSANQFVKGVGKVTLLVAIIFLAALTGNL